MKYILDERTRTELTAILPRLRRFALGLARHPSDADDLVQAAVEKAIKRIHQWQPGTRLDSWMFRIIQTTHIDLMRSRKRQSAYVEMAEGQTNASFDGQAAIEASLTLKSVQKAILDLPEEQRSVVMLVSVEGKAYKDAAEILGIPIGTLTSRLVRARTALAKRLEGDSNTGSSASYADSVQSLKTRGKV